MHNVQFDTEFAVFQCLRLILSRYNVVITGFD